MIKAHDDPLSLLTSLTLPLFTIPGNIFLAPMAGWTDAAFRSICIEWGAYLTYTEMVSAEAVKRKNCKTLDLLKRADNEKHLCVQIFASSGPVAGQAVRVINRYKPSVVDINCGCSVPKILKSGCGAALLRSSTKIRDIVKAMRNETDVPITVKLRSGWDSESINYLDTAEQAQEGGACMVCLHPRTRAQLLGGKANWNHIKELKRSVTLPVIGSGDLFTANDVRFMLEETGCDGVMIGRGAMGNPFIFRETVLLLQSNEVAHKPSTRLRMYTALKQLRLAISIKGEQVACREMRKQLCAYSKGIPGSASLRRRISQASVYKEYETIINDFLRE
jgi:tRNA-dihydrouridine synthase B